MIENTIKKEILKILPKSKLKKNQKFISDGYLDSFNVLILISNLEKTFKIKINLKKFNLKNLETIKSISKLVKKLQIKRK